MLGKQNYFLRALEKDRENLLMKKAGLMHDLLTGKVAVKVDEAQEEHV